MGEIKRIIVNILASTCLVLTLLIVTAIIIDGISVHEIGQRTIQVNIIIQIFAANILIHLGLHLTKKIESKYVIFEFLLDIGYITVVILVFGIIFDWYSTRSWILIIMVVVIYIFGVLINMFRSKQDAKEINELIKKRKEKNIDIAS